MSWAVFPIFSTPCCSCYNEAYVRAVMLDVDQTIAYSFVPTSSIE